MWIAALAGISAGVAVNAKPKISGQLYYGVLGDDRNIRWTDRRPLGSYSCNVHALFACTITSTTPILQVLSMVNQYPPQFTIMNNSHNRIYKRQF